MSRHTPGSWEADERKACGAIRPVNDSQIIVAYVPLDDTRELCDGRIEEVKSRQNEINQRLIAAAPELLEALEAVRANFTNGYGETRWPDGNAVWQQIEAAIAKATGE